MTIPLIVYRSLRQHAFSTLVTAISIALAGGLLMSVWTIRQEARTAFTGITGGFDAVLGARGSKLQLVLNAIFHLEESTGNLAAEDVETIAKHPAVEVALPIAMGDNLRGYRIVGTLPDLFTKVEYLPGKRYQVAAPGRAFEEEFQEAVLGSFVAQKLGLKIGDKIHPYHGLNFDESKAHADEYVIVGIMEPSNTPADRVVWIPLAGIQNMEGHDPNKSEDVSAVLVKLKASSPMAGRMLEQMYNQQGNRLTFAWPIAMQMAQLFNKINWFERVLELVAYLVAAVATGSVTASIYNSMNERRREIAILRSLGARRGTVMSSIILEAASIAALGMIAALALHFALMSGVAAIVRTETGVVLDPFELNPALLWAPLGMIALSALAGIIPAVKAYRTDVAQNLAPVS